MPRLSGFDLASLPKLSSVTVRKTAFTPAGDEKLKQTNAKVRISR